MLLRNGASRAVNTYKARLIERIANLDPRTAADLRAIKLPWYEIRNAVPPAPAPDKEEEGDGEEKEPAAEIFIYDEIGGSLGVDANEFVQDLQKVTAKNIDVRINSPGGSVFDAVAIYNALVKHPANVTTYVDSLAASAASIIAMAGDTCVMMIGAQMMIHDALGVEMGNSRAFREMADFLDRQTENLATIYLAKAESKTGMALDDWLKLMADETWMFAQEAVDLGLADSVYTRAAEREMMPPDEDQPETPDEEKSDTEPESPEEDAADIDDLMAVAHRLTNRGFKYSGRTRAPQPPVRATYIDGLIDNMLGKVVK